MAIRRTAGAVAGLVAAAVALGVSELVAALIARRSSPILAVGSTVIDVTPTWLREFAIRTFGSNDKRVLIGCILLVLGGLAAVVGLLALRHLAWGAIGVVALSVVGAAAALSRPSARWFDILPSLVGALAGASALVILVRRLEPRSVEPGSIESTAAQPDAFDRRRFLLASLTGAVVAAASGVTGRLLLRREEAVASRAGVRLPTPVSPAAALPADADLALPRLSPFITRNAAFYRVDTALIGPQVAASSWQLRVHGLVDRVLELSFDELLRRPLIERDITLTCVSNDVGGPLAGNARWLGARLADVLREAGISNGADQLLSRSTDGMTIGTPLDVVMDGRDALLAVGMNGKPLPLEHGFPVRMVVPGLYGYVSATKWVVDIELTTFGAYDAYWVRRGWAQQAPIKTESRIDRKSVV